MEAMAPHVRGHLYAGMPIKDLRELCGGCTERWTCPRLIAVRKRYE